jgi:hypothetical protein
MKTVYTAQFNLAYRNPQNGKMVTYRKGQEITAVKWNSLPTTVQARFLGKQLQTAEAQVLIDDYLRVFIEAYNNGCQIFGGYKDIFEQVVEVLDIPAKWCGYRGMHVAEAARRFENQTQVHFENLCPDVRDFASDWRSDLG